MLIHYFQHSLDHEVLTLTMSLISACLNGQSRTTLCSPFSSTSCRLPRLAKSNRKPCLYGSEYIPQNMFTLSCAKLRSYIKSKQTKIIYHYNISFVIYGSVCRFQRTLSIHLDHQILNTKLTNY